MTITEERPLRVFVCEFVTGGGLMGEALPPSLAREGETMAAALIDDLTALAGTQVLTTRDLRLGPAPPRAETLAPGPDEDIWDCWRRGVRAAEALWPIAPETGGVLERLSRLALEEGRVLLGSRPEAVRLCASKRATAAHLAAHGIPVVPAAPADAPPPAAAAGWVVKPDDGAGCENTRVFAQAAALRAWTEHEARAATAFVVQPYLPGTAASISALFREGTARVLACNRQDVVRAEDGRLHHRGGETGALEAHRPALAALAEAVARAIPGLWGHAGIDLVLSPEGPVVLEVNPRLTTSYAGLRGVLGRNPAGLALDLGAGPGPGDAAGTAAALAAGGGGG